MEGHSKLIPILSALSESMCRCGLPHGHPHRQQNATLPVRGQGACMILPRRRSIDRVKSAPVMITASNDQSTVKIRYKAETEPQTSGIDAFEQPQSPTRIVRKSSCSHQPNSCGHYFIGFTEMSLSHVLHLLTLSMTLFAILIVLLALCREVLLSVGRSIRLI